MHHQVMASVARRRLEMAHGRVQLRPGTGAEYLATILSRRFFADTDDHANLSIGSLAECAERAVLLGAGERAPAEALNGAIVVVVGRTQAIDLRLP